MVRKRSEGGVVAWVGLVCVTTVQAECVGVGVEFGFTDLSGLPSGGPLLLTSVCWDIVMSTVKLSLM